MTSTGLSQSLKRKREDECILETLPPTPPLAPEEDTQSIRALKKVKHVLSIETQALQSVAMLYEQDAVAQDGFLKAVHCICTAVEADRKVIVCGIGKSGIVGRKLVATMKSLGIASSFLHAAEAMHGDLGDVRKGDAVLFITFSGATQELLGVLEHLPEEIHTIAITAHHESPIVVSRRLVGTVFLPAGTPLSELDTFGIRAPTTSTTVAIAIGDALALACAERLHVDEWKLSEVFQKNHPGGAIGKKDNSWNEKPLRHVATELGEMTTAYDIPSEETRTSDGESRCTTPNSARGWVRYNRDSLIKPSAMEKMLYAAELPKLKTPFTSVYRVPWNFTVADARNFVKSFPDSVKQDGVLGIVEDDTYRTCKDGSTDDCGIYAVIEIQDLLKEDLGRPRQEIT